MSAGRYTIFSQKCENALYATYYSFGCTQSMCSSFCLILNNTFYSCWRSLGPWPKMKLKKPRGKVAYTKTPAPTLLLPLTITKRLPNLMEMMWMIVRHQWALSARPSSRYWHVRNDFQLTGPIDPQNCSVCSCKPSMPSRVAKWGHCDCSHCWYYTYCNVGWPCCHANSWCKDPVVIYPPDAP